MEDLPLGRITALVPEFAAKDPPLGRRLMNRPIIDMRLWSKTLSRLDCFDRKSVSTGVPSSSIGVAREKIMTDKVEFSYHQIFSTFQSPSLCHFILSLINFTSYSTSFIVMKNSRFGASPVYNHTGCWGGGAKWARIMCSSIGLRALVRKGSGMTDRHSSTRGSA